jgi:hypothetical protein
LKGALSRDPCGEVFQVAIRRKYYTVKQTMSQLFVSVRWPDYLDQAGNARDPWGSARSPGDEQAGAMSVRKCAFSMAWRLLDRAPILHGR